jgi:hypothetical protein
MRTIGLALSWNRRLGSSIVALSMRVVVLSRLSGDDGWHRSYWTRRTVMRFVRGRWCTSSPRWTRAGTIRVRKTGMMSLWWLSGIAGIVRARRWRKGNRLDRWPVLLLRRYLRRTAARCLMVQTRLYWVAIFNPVVKRLSLTSLTSGSVIETETSKRHFQQCSLLVDPIVDWRTRWSRCSG